MGKKVICLFLAVCLTVILFPLNSVIAKAKTVTVSNYTMFMETFHDDDVSEIIVSDTIVFPKDDRVILDGNGKTVRAEKTGVDESGIVQSGFGRPLFYVLSDSVVKISNLTIMGGSYNAIYNQGTLTLDGVTVTRSGSSSAAGGGIYNSKGILILKNCNIIRNVASYGGGIINYGGKVIMDGCSLSENRSISTSGGGAAENKDGGIMYINNSVISNNTSAEIGGGINNYNSTLYIMNSTVTGNATTGGANSGGGIGLNGGKLYAVNSIFTDNYYIPKTGDVVKSDIGKYSNGSVRFYNCVYGTLQGISASGSKNKVAAGTDVFAGYQTSGILTGAGTMSEKTYSHPVLAKSDRGLLYAPLDDDSPAVSDGVPTYFDYYDISIVKMSYGEEKNSVSLGELNTTDGLGLVNRYIEDNEDGTRSSDTIGASGSTDKQYYTVRLLPSANGTASGGTVYGDSYEEGTEVTLTAVPAEGSSFIDWKKNGTEVLSTDTDYTFNVTETITIQPSFTAPNSSGTDITVFSIGGNNGTIDSENHTVSLVLPRGTDLKNFAPNITLSDNASVLPASGAARDFTKPVTYTVRAENGTTQVWTVSITLESVPATYSSGEPLPVEWAGEENPNTGFEFSFFSWIINLFA